MAVDKLVDSSQLDSDLNSIANTILELSGGTGPIVFPSGFVSEIDNIDVGQPVYSSSTGLLYTPIMTIDITMGASGGNLLTSIMARYGNMPYLEELTLIGRCMSSPTAGTITNAGNETFSIGKLPLLKKLSIIPTEVRDTSGKVIDSSSANYNLFKFGHDLFNKSNLRELTLGKIGGPYFLSGGYFRSKNENGSNDKTIGSTDGLTLKIYTNSYKTNGGFNYGTLKSNTTIIEYDYLTGEILTPD